MNRWILAVVIIFVGAACYFLGYGVGYAQIDKEVFPLKADCRDVSSVCADEIERLCTRRCG